MASSWSCFRCSAASSSSRSNWPTVGTFSGSKSSTSFGSIGTQTRDVLGCIQKGDLSKWFLCFDTSASRRGYVYWSMMSCIADRRGPYSGGQKRRRWFRCRVHTKLDDSFSFACLRHNRTAAQTLSDEEGALTRLPSLSCHSRLSCEAVGAGKSCNRASMPCSELKHSWFAKITSTNAGLRKVNASLMRTRQMKINNVHASLTLMKVVAHALLVVRSLSCASPFHPKSRSASPRSPCVDRPRGS
jgi:hypothetical protein